MKTIEYQIYRYDELSEQAKQVAIESTRDSIADMRIETESAEYRNTLEMIERIFRVNIYDWSVDEYNSYFRFNFVGIDEDVETEPRLLLRYLNNNVLPCIDNRKRYYTRGCKASRKSKIISENEYDCCITGTWTDLAIDDALNNIKKSLKKHLNAREFVENLLEGFFKQWQNDYEDACSDEYIAEEIETNDYEFYENGKPYTD